jgi:hypothetical protein
MNLSIAQPENSNLNKLIVYIGGEGGHPPKLINNCEFISPGGNIFLFIRDFYYHGKIYQPPHPLIASGTYYKGNRKEYYFVWSNMAHTNLKKGKKQMERSI